MLYSKYVPKETVFLIRQIDNDKNCHIYLFCMSALLCVCPVSHFYSDCVFHMDGKVVLDTHWLTLQVNPLAGRSSM